LAAVVAVLLALVRLLRLLDPGAVAELAVDM
jgi:hypothetical protein